MSQDIKDKFLTEAEQAVLDLVKRWQEADGTTVYLTGLKAGEMAIDRQTSTLSRRADTVSPEMLSALEAVGVIDTRQDGRDAFDTINSINNKPASDLLQNRFGTVSANEGDLADNQTYDAPS